MSTYTKGQLIWAKIKGQAWWPAKITQTNANNKRGAERELEVSFIDNPTYAMVTEENLAKFDEPNFKKFSKAKNKKLQEAIKVAQQMTTLDPKPVIERKKPQRGRKASLPPAVEIEEAEDEAPIKRGRGRPRKNSSQSEQPRSSTKEKPSASKQQKSKKQEKEERKTTKKNETTVINTPNPPAKRTPKRMVKITVEKAAVSTPSRLTRSQSNKGQVELMTDSLPVTSRKGRKASATRGEQKKSASKSANKTPTKKEKSKSPVSPKTDIKAPSTKPLVIDTEKTPERERPQERNLLKSITAEPSPNSPHIEVTTRKVYPRSQCNSVVSKGFSVRTSKTTNSNKRPSAIWLKDVPSSVYVNHVIARDLRNSASEYVVKKQRVAPGFQQKILSMQGTKLKDIQENKNNAGRATGAFNALMIRKFENDLELLIHRLAIKFKGQEEMNGSDKEYLKMLNIVGEIDRSKFTGSEFAGSDIGRLLKTLYSLLLNSKSLLNNTAEKAIPVVAKILHKVKDAIIKFCLDNTIYADEFDIPNKSLNPVTPVAETASKINVKQEEPTPERRDKTQLFKAGKRSISVEDEPSNTNQDKEEEKYNSPQFGVLKNKNYVNNEKPAFGDFTVSKPPGERDLNKATPKRLEGKTDMPPSLPLRMKASMQIAVLLQSSYSIGADLAQEITLGVENAIDKCYPDSYDEYEQAIKALSNIIKIQDLSLETIAGMRDLSSATLKEILMRKSVESENHPKEKVLEMSFTKNSQITATKENNKKIDTEDMIGLVRGNLFGKSEIRNDESGTGRRRRSARARYL